MKSLPKVRGFFLLSGFLAIIFIMYPMIDEWWSWRQTPIIEDYSGQTGQGVLVVAADLDFAPYSFVDAAGNPSGHDVEMIYAIAERLRMRVDIRLMKWREACEAVQTGEADLLLGIEYDPESRKEFALSMPLQNDQFVVFSKGDFTKVSELYRMRIATMEKSASHALFLGPYKLEKNTTDYSTYGEVFASVERGENDCAIARYSVGRRAIAQMDSTTIRAVGPPLVYNHLSIGTRLENAKLIDEVDGAIQSLIKDGTMDRLAGKWLGSYVQEPSLREVLYRNRVAIASSILLVAAALLFLYACINRRRLQAAELQQESLVRLIEYQQLLAEATEGLYEGIYEIDLTHNCAGDDTTRRYFESLGMAANMPYDEALQIIAKKQVKPEYIQSYLDTFSPEAVLEAYHQGINHLNFDFMITSDGINYYWMRITARIFYWKADKSVHLLVYRQNIDAEKQHEAYLLEKIQHDSMTNLYNKQATGQMIDKLLEESCLTRHKHAFFILDIDNFKGVNDTFGHMFGDFVITEFAAVFRQMFAERDVIGRIGGDEFVVFIREVASKEAVVEKARNLVEALHREIAVGEKTCTVSASIGIALYPSEGESFAALYKSADQALYKAKARGKNGFCWDEMKKSIQV